MRDKPETHTVCYQATHFDVTGFYTAGSPGTRHGPPDSPEFEITKVTLADDPNDLYKFLSEETILELGDYVLERIEEEAREGDPDA